MADAADGGAEAENVTMVESTMPTTMATPAPTAIGTATAATDAGNGIDPTNGTGAATPNVYCDPTRLRQVIRLDHGGTQDRGGMEGRCGVSARTTERKSRNRNRPLGIRHCKQTEVVDGGG